MIEFKNIYKTFKTKDAEVHALQDVSLNIEKGDIFGVIGFSGAGKSTLVRMVNALEIPTGGTVTVKGRTVSELKGTDLRKFRKNIGMIFQHFNLLESKTVFQNIAIPLELEHWKKDKITRRVNELLKFVELEDKIGALPGQLSGGQKQRVGIARALALNPEILLCDEATSALDPTTTRSILKLLKKLNEQLNLTIVIITHQMEVIKEICGKVAVMENGKIVEQGDVFSIFANPQNEVTKRFIRATSNLTKIDELIAENSPVVKLSAGEKLVRFSYIQKDVCEPLISATSRLYDITMNIIFAEIDFVQGSPIGGTVAIVSGKSEAIDRALEHIRDEGVGVEILKTA